ESPPWKPRERSASSRPPCTRWPCASVSRNGTTLRTEAIGPLRAAILSLSMVLASGPAALGQDGGSAPAGGDASAPAIPKDPLANGNRLYEKGDYAAAAEQYLLAARTAKVGINRAFAWFNLG